VERHVITAGLCEGKFGSQNFIPASPTQYEPDIIVSPVYRRSARQYSEVRSNKNQPLQISWHPRLPLHTSHLLYLSFRHYEVCSSWLAVAACL